MVMWRWWKSQAVNEGKGAGNIFWLAARTTELQSGWSEKMTWKREDLRDWITWSCHCSCQSKWCCWPQLIFLRGVANRKKERLTSGYSYELISNQSPEVTELSPKAFWEHRSKSCGDNTAHKQYYQPICKTDTRYGLEFYCRRKTAIVCVCVASVYFLFKLKS